MSGTPSIMTKPDIIRKTFKSIAAGLYLGIAAIGLTNVSAHAALIDQGMTTSDDATQLEWLDLTQTVSQSHNAVLAGFGGFIASGFRIAVETEVGTLISNAEVVSRNGINSLNPLDVAGVALFNTLLGITDATNPTVFNFSIGVYELDVVDPVNAGQVKLQFDKRTPIRVRVTHFSPVSKSQTALKGVFLVRTVAIPEPGTLRCPCSSSVSWVSVSHGV